MTIRAGSRRLLFGDGKIRNVPAHKVDEALTKFGAVDPPGSSFGRRLGMPATVQKMLDAAPDAFGMAGQVAGGAVGAPALALGPAGVLVPATTSVAGAGIGGAVGQGVRELGYRAAGMGDAPGTIGGASEGQAKGAVAGELLGLGSRLLARPLMSHAMGSPGVVPGMPNPVETNLTEVRAPVGRMFGRPGSKKANDAVGESARTLKRHLRAMAKSGVKVDVVEVIKRAHEKLSKEFAQNATYVEQRHLNKMYNSTIAKHGKMLDPRMGNILKQRWDRSSRPVLKAIEKSKKGGPLPDPTVNTSAQWEKALADEMRSEIEKVSGAFTGDLAVRSPARAINRITQRRIGVADLIEGAEAAKRSVNPVVTALGGVGAGLLGGFGSHSALGGGAYGVAGMLGSHMLSQPEATSRLALWATDPTMQLLMRTTPRFVWGPSRERKPE